MLLRKKGQKTRSIYKQKAICKDAVPSLSTREKRMRLR